MLYFGQIGWTGGYDFWFDNIANHDSTSVLLALDMAVAGFNPLYLIQPGETFVSPQVHIGALIGNLDAAVNASYDHIRRSVLNLPEANGDACIVGSIMGAEHDMSIETTKSFMDQMARVGAELFIVDAGWFAPPDRLGDWPKLVGNWQDDRDRYPNGIVELCDYAHSKGLKFGIWMCAEVIGEASRCRAEHPEWQTTDIFGKKDFEVLDLTNPDAVA